MIHYLKYTLFHLLLVPGVVGFTLGGHWLGLGLLFAILLVVGGDLILGDDKSTPKMEQTWLLNLQLYSALPVMFLLYFLILWSVAEGDPLGYGAWIESITGYVALAARETNSAFDYIVALFTTILFTGVVGTIVAHELTHRTWDPISLLIGRWLLAFSYDVGFSIEHVYGHHVYVSCENDPATAPRGRNVYTHIVVSTIEGNVSAHRLEKTRLERLGLSVWSLQNRFLRGLLMSAALVVVSYAIAGLMGVLFFSISALGAKALLEIVNYMEHYGMVRNPATPVQPRHSWNSNKKISSWATFNLTRHSHHHAQGDLPFWNLKPYEGAPMMINGYLTTVFLTLVPPLWHKLMVPKLLEWDAHYADEEERVLAAEANRKSGLVGLMDYNGYDAVKA